ncbi:MAG: hypothetical protein RL095_430 [Verrucomicrobiota bacterium]
MTEAITAQTEEAALRFDQDHRAAFGIGVDRETEARELAAVESLRQDKGIGIGGGQEPGGIASTLQGEAEGGAEAAPDGEGVRREVFDQQLTLRRQIELAEPLQAGGVGEGLQSLPTPGLLAVIEDEGEASIILAQEACGWSGGGVSWSKSRSCLQAWQVFQ